MTDPGSLLDTPENWDAASDGYADKVAPILMRPFSEALVECLDLNDGMSVLEVGAGSGALTEALSRRAGAVLATDFSPRMVELLRKRCERLGSTNVRCEVMDGQALALEDGSFDAAACSFALMLFPDRHKGFSELCRVVRPGGRVAVSGWAGPDRFELLGLFLGAVRAALPELPAPADPPPVFSLADPASFREQMEAAGFSDVRVDLVARELTIPDVDTFWGMLTTGAPPVKVLFDRVGDGGKDRIREELGRMVASRFGTGPITVTNVATIGSGTAT